MNRYRIQHVTTTSYESPVTEARHLAHLVPRRLPWQEVHKPDLVIDPGAASYLPGTDSFGNRNDEIEVVVPHDELVVSVTSEVVVHPREVPGQSGPTALAWDAWAKQVAGQPDPELLDMLGPTALVPLLPEITAWAKSSFAPGRSLVEAAMELNHRLYSDFTYTPGATDLSTPLHEVMSDRVGVCQDFAHVLLAALRSVGLPARYVSGYLETVPPEGQERLVGADASHAWVALALPWHGWLDLDPTNDCVPGTRHITVAWGRDYADVSPLRGVVFGGGEQQVEVSVDVAPLAVAASDASGGQRQSQSL